MDKISIETENEMELARRISANGFGRIDAAEKGYCLTIFPEYAIMEKLFTVYSLERFTNFRHDSDGFTYANQ